MHLHKNTPVCTFSWKETFFFFLNLKATHELRSDLTSVWFGTHAKPVTALEKEKKRWHYISVKRQVFLRPQSEGIVPVAERRSPAGRGSRHAGRRCWFRAFSWRSLTLMEKKQKKKQRVLPASSSQQKLRMMMKTAERNALPSLALENLQQAPCKIWPPSLFCSFLVPLTSPTLPLSIFLLLSRTDPHSWEGLGRAEAERD